MKVDMKGDMNIKGDMEWDKVGGHKGELEGDMQNMYG